MTSRLRTPMSMFTALLTLIMCVQPTLAFTSPMIRTTAAAAAAAATATSKTRTTPLFAAPIGPVARARRMADPKDYERVIQSKMKKSKLSREKAEEEYNDYLENPPFYYALDQKKKRYAELGYKDMFEGMIGEAEKEGRGDEVRARISKFQATSRIKAFSVLAVAVSSFWYFRTVYIADPENFLPGI